MSRERSKRSFSLVEALVAIALFSLVVGTLFGLFRHNVRISEELNTIKQNSERLRRTHFRLQYLFSKLIFKSQDCHVFYSPSKKAKSESDAGQSLIFTFDNGTDRENGFSYDVLARLYLDEEKNLSLAIWPNPKLKQSQPESIRKEVLLDGVESMSLEFWKGKLLKTNVPAEKLEKWLPTWDEEYKELPTLVRMTLKYETRRGKEEVLFSFLTKPTDINAIKLVE